MKLLALILITLPLTHSASFPVRYDGHVLVAATTETQLQLKYLVDLEMNTNVDFWIVPGTTIGKTVHIHLDPKQLSTFKLASKAIGLNFTIVVNNLQRLIDLTSNSSSEGNTTDEPQGPADALLSSSRQRREISSPVGNYSRYAEITSWLEELAAENDFVETENIGTTYENRTITLVKIGSRPRSSSISKPALWLDGNIHAREWLTGTTVIYIIDKLVEDYKDGENLTKALIDHFDIYLLPIANPDGYEYSHTHDRLWRKSRSLQPSQSWGKNCYGTDLNRNWPIGFGGAATYQDPCEITNPGIEPFSEPETTAMRDKMKSLGDRLKAYISLHTYGYLWFVPWSHTTETPEDDVEMVCTAGVFTLQSVFGTKE